MKVLVACEESQEVCKAFRALGHEAYSCDVQPPSGGHPEWHIQGDVLPLINGRCEFATMDGAGHRIDGRWDILIAHPPCTHLTVACAATWPRKRETGEQQAAAEFFMAFVNADCKKVCIENPVGYMNTYYRKPDQTIHPWMFGHQVCKRTCLWLKGLPLLWPTDVVSHGEKYTSIRRSGKRQGEVYSTSMWYHKASYLPREERGKLRSKTFPGIARAMAEQWGGLADGSGSGWGAG